jgi:hypothetical protein
VHLLLAQIDYERTATNSTFLVYILSKEVNQGSLNSPNQSDKFLMTGKINQNKDMEINEIRRKNLHELLRQAHPKEHGRMKYFSNRMKWSPQRVSSIAGANPTRGIGPNTARLIETEFGVPRYWLDTQHNTVRDTQTEYGEPEEIDPKSIERIELPVLNDEQIRPWLEGEINPDQATAQLPRFNTTEPLGSRAFAYIEQTTMMPPWEPGDIYYINPDFPTKTGKFTLCRTDDGQIVAGTLGKTLKGWQISFSDSRERPIIVQDIIGPVIIALKSEFLDLGA